MNDSAEFRMEDSETGIANAGSTGSINLCPCSSNVDVSLADQVHHLPCSIKFTGPSPVSHYFKPCSTGFEADGLLVKEACFRGRKLQGTTIQLPEGYSGYVIGKKNTVKDKAKKNRGKGKVSESDVDFEHWQALTKFCNITFWNHDTPPSQDDACLRSFHWFAVSKALHEPVSEEDLACDPATQHQIDK